MPVRKRRQLPLSLGSELRKARMEAGYTQEGLAFEAELDRTYISYLENGHKSPTVETLFRICRVLGIAASELIGRVERSLDSRKK
jgi:transcriptional regulator with XRE-family HTH domain